MKQALILAFLFLSACAPDSNHGNTGSDKVVVVSEEILQRAELLSQWYEVSMEKIRQVPWYQPGDESALMLESYVFGANLPRELMDSLARVPMMFETLMKMQDHSPASPEMLKLARRSLEQ